VKITKPEAMQNEFAFVASKCIGAESLATYSFPELDSPTKSISLVELSSPELDGVATREETKQNSGKVAKSENCLSRYVTGIVM
jgi:hypothetical protein